MRSGRVAELTSAPGSREGPIACCELLLPRFRRGELLRRQESIHAPRAESTLHSLNSVPKQIPSALDDCRENTAKRKPPDRGRGRREGKGHFRSESFDSTRRGICLGFSPLQVLQMIFSQLSSQPAQAGQGVQMAQSAMHCCDEPYEFCRPRAKPSVLSSVSIPATVSIHF
jgi:hypothetical protein